MFYSTTLVVLFCTLGSVWSASVQPGYFNQGCLTAHNSVRSQFGVPSLRFNKTLADVAINHAKSNLASNQLRSLNGDHGENLYYMSLPSNGQISCKAAVDLWSEQSKNYNYKTPRFGQDTGAFTQVVWKSSTDLGCGVAANDKVAYITCLYSPPGNVEGQFPNNVLRKRS